MPFGYFYGLILCNQMSGQVAYYNRFGEAFKEAILACPEPHLWTTDYHEKGRIYQEMKERIETQTALVKQYLKKELPVLDVGCGFGRQACLLAKSGFTVTGTDTSEVFIQIAQELFQKHHLQGRFLFFNILQQTLPQRFSQALLLDVLEHVSPRQRHTFVSKLASLMEPQGLLLVSLPTVKKRWRSQLNNRYRKLLTQHLSWFKRWEEHPYPIPQRQDLVRLTGQQFRLIATMATNETDYYVLEKKEEA